MGLGIRSELLHDTILERPRPNELSLAFSADNLPQSTTRSTAKPTRTQIAAHTATYPARVALQTFLLTSSPSAYTYLLATRSSEYPITAIASHADEPSLLERIDRKNSEVPQLVDKKQPLLISLNAFARRALIALLTIANLAKSLRNCGSCTHLAAKCGRYCEGYALQRSGR